MASACRSRVVDGRVTTGGGGRRGVTIDVEVVERSGVVDGGGTTGLEDVEGVATDVEDGTIDVERWTCHDRVVDRWS